MINDIHQTAQEHMEKSIESLRSELSKVRTGRAHTSILEHIMVPYYGNNTPMNQVASVTVGDPRTLVVTPWDKNAVQAVEKAIMQANLGLNPATAGQVIRVPLPPLTEERRKDLTKVIRNTVENSRVSIRNIRRDANTQLKDLLKEKTISEDEEHRAQEAIQKLTDKNIEIVDKLLADKEKDIMTV